MHDGVDGERHVVAGRALSVSFPASSPYATSAGGQLMGLNAADEIQGQQVWDDLPLGSGLAGGGGQSAVFGRPWYQQHLTTAGHGRLVPDMALEADLALPHRRTTARPAATVMAGQVAVGRAPPRLLHGGRDRPGR